MLSQIRIFNTVTGDNIDTPVDAWARDGPFSFSLLPHRELVLASQKYGLSSSQLQALESLAVDEGMLTPLMVVARIFQLVGPRGLTWCGAPRRPATRC